MKRDFIGSCVTNPFPTTEILTGVIQSALEITKKTFLLRCNVPVEVMDLMKRFPHDYSYYRCSRYKGQYIYFYEWSRIEFFYGFYGEVI